MANIPLKSIKFPDLADTYTVPTNAGELPYDKNATYPDDTVGKALQDKPDADGTIANAEQLTSNIYEEDSVPYNFRTSGGSIDIGDRETDMIVGGTVGWNQLAKQFEQGNWVAENGVTIDFEDDVLVVSSTTVNNGAYCGTPATFKNGHKYLVTSKIKTETNLDVVVVGGLSSTGVTKSISVQAGQWVDNSYVAQSILDGTSRLYCYARNTQYSNLRVKDFMFIDLTQMFGSTIADYIYSLEQATAGAGVAWFKKLFPKPYYEYNAGELMSVNTSAHNTVGFNQWDEDWEVGQLNITNGDNETGTSRIRSKNYIPCLPNMVYGFAFPLSAHLQTGDIRVFYYDADKNFITYINWIGLGATFTTPSNAYYLRFYTNGTYGDTYNHDICINLSWDGERDGEYEEYVKHSYPLDSSLTLRGIPKLDNGNLYYDGDTYESDGTVTRKFTSISPTACIDGYTRPNGDFIGRLASNGRATDNYLPANIISNLGLPVLGANYHYNDSGSGLAINANNGQVIICIAGITSKADLDTWLATNRPTFIYELATPTTETADPYTNPQIVDDFGTEEYVDYAVSQGDRDVSIPVGHYTQYMANLKAKLEMSPNSPEGAGDYIVRQTNGENEYVTLASNATIQDIIARLEALENAES